MLDKRARAHVERELQQIERLLEEYRPLLEAAQTAEPELVERTALGAVLQSFYTGVENVFQTIAKRVDQDMPTGEDWHKELLYQMARSTEVRPFLLLQPNSLSRTWVFAMSPGTRTRSGWTGIRCGTLYGD